MVSISLNLLTNSTSETQNPRKDIIIPTVIACLGGPCLANLPQSFVMGADAVAESEMELPRAGRQFTFEDLNFEGFQQQAGSLPPDRPQGQLGTVQPALKNFRSVQFGTVPTPGTFLREMQSR